MSHDDHKPSTFLKRGYSYSFEIDDGGHIHHPDTSDTVFATFSTSTAKRGKCTHKYGIAPAENSCVPPCIFVPDKELDCLTDSHVKLNILVDTQEPFNDSHHKIAFNYDEDTMSLVEEPILATSEVSLSNNSDSSAGIASIAFEYYCYEIEADTPQFNYYGPKIKIPKQELPMTICTAYNWYHTKSKTLSSTL